MSSKRVSVNPLALFLKPQSPDERLSSGTVRSCRGRGSLKELQRKQRKQRKQKARGEAVMKRPVGRPFMQLQEQAFSSQPFQALPLGHPHRVNMASG